VIAISFSSRAPRRIITLFSTFGGNPVACAAGRAVLDVIENENLIANANEVGDYFRAQLRQLMQTQPLIGDVRCQGLLIAVELVTDRVTRTPATALMKPLLESLRQHGVLVGSAGRNSNILKIRPPIILQKEHADFFVEALRRGLAEVGNGLVDGRE
jgi:4-aminobutyrate aminotransferase-like enzyme